MVARAPCAVPAVRVGARARQDRWTRGFSFQRFTARWLANSTSHSRLRHTSTKPTTARTQCCSRPKCPDKPFPVFFWKYAGSTWQRSKQAQARGMLAHWRLRHSQRSMPEALRRISSRSALKSSKRCSQWARCRRSCAHGASAGAPGPTAACCVSRTSSCCAPTARRMLRREVATPSTVRQRRWWRSEAGG